VGTFHEGKGQLHGITVVVDTDGPEVWVGRCDTMTVDRIVLLGADRHDESEGASSKQEWIERVATVGFFPRHDRVVLELGSVISVKRLGEIAA